MIGESPELRAALRQLLTKEVAGRGITVDDRLLDRVMSRVAVVISVEVRERLVRASGS